MPWPGEVRGIRALCLLRRRAGVHVGLDRLRVLKVPAQRAVQAHETFEDVVTHVVPELQRRHIGKLKRELLPRAQQPDAVPQVQATPELG